MIRIEFEEKPYEYSTGRQEYNIKTTVELNEDIDAVSALRAFIRVLNGATYRVTPSTIERLANSLEDDGYKSTDLIIS